MGKINDIVLAIRQAVSLFLLACVSVMKSQRDNAEIERDQAKGELRELEVENAIRKSHSGESPADTIHKFLGSVPDDGNKKP